MVFRSRAKEDEENMATTSQNVMSSLILPLFLFLFSGLSRNILFSKSVGWMETCYAHLHIIFHIGPRFFTMNVHTLFSIRPRTILFHEVVFNNHSLAFSLSLSLPDCSSSILGSKRRQRGVNPGRGYNNYYYEILQCF